MTKEPTTKKQIEKLTEREEKILKLLREERSLIAQKFPLPYALLATFGFVATWAGLYGLIQKIELLKHNPIISLIVGVTILVVTGTAYRKLG